MMSEKKLLCGNEAVAHIAYKLSDVCPIYPITPATTMSERVEAWSAMGYNNIFGSIPTVIPMQGEGGVAGALHGAIQTGSLGATFTASQGLLLMAPNMYKMAGELCPNVIHVATRSIATHALSVFGDHSDIMAVRDTGYAFLGSANVQEAMDLALVAHCAALESRIPFVHFFDGFRTSHELSTVEVIPDAIIQNMFPFQSIMAHKDRALTPENPVLKGSSQGPETFFESREAMQPYYNACPDIVQGYMDALQRETGRAYRLFDYIGHEEADHVLIAMASAGDTIEKAVLGRVARGERIGLIKVRLFRPFSKKHLLQALPLCCSKITVLDRCKMPGATGEPLYNDIVVAVSQLFQEGLLFHLPEIYGGRYGLSSKEFTPSMVDAIFNEMISKESLKNSFTIGILDDVSHSSIPYTTKTYEGPPCVEALLIEDKPETKDGFRAVLNLLQNRGNLYLQGYQEATYAKAHPIDRSHIRYGHQPIQSPYLSENLQWIALNSAYHLGLKEVRSMRRGGVVLLLTENSILEVLEKFNDEVLSMLIEKEIRLHWIHPKTIGTSVIIENENISPLQACFLALQMDAEIPELLPISEHIYGISLAGMPQPTKAVELQKPSPTLVTSLLNGYHDLLPVSLFPVDGTFETGTSHLWNPNIDGMVPSWDSATCVPCGLCTLTCSQNALQVRAIDTSKTVIPEGLDYRSIEGWNDEMDLLHFTIQVNPDQCTSCNLCIEVCPSQALTPVSNKEQGAIMKSHFNFVDSLPILDRSEINPYNLLQQQFKQALFQYPDASQACGEAAYLKVLSQLFGNRMLVANATGSTSIFGGALPTTPWCKDKNGRGPAWANSLFEDNAEFGYGFRLSLDQQRVHCERLLRNNDFGIDHERIEQVLSAPCTDEKEIARQRIRVQQIKRDLESSGHKKARITLSLLDSLIPKSIWIVGGDGWAYDIGYSGLDHVMASSANVNILVLDNEMYDNTGGQVSKATPKGARAQFAYGGKKNRKKDLGAIAMNYEHVYVASVSLGADPEHTLRTFLEAERHEGPSLIIAYVSTEAHGYMEGNKWEHQKWAVDSGYWPLYRRDPKVSSAHILQMDSTCQTMEIEKFMEREARFQIPSMLEASPN